MGTDLIQLSFDKIMQTHSYTVIILKANSVKFAIYADPSVGRILQMYLTETDKPRPLTHDLISNILKGFEIRVKQIVIHDVQETTYYARLFLEQQVGSKRHMVEIDIRPSDGITIALMHNAPLYCARDVLKKIIPVVE